MKKTFALLAAALLMVSLTACSGTRKPLEEQDTKPSVGTEPISDTEATQDPEQEKPELNYEEGVDYWGFAEVAQPAIPGLTWTDFTAPDGTEVEKATTPFTVDMASVYQTLQGNAYLAEVAPELSLSKTEKYENSEYEDGIYRYGMVELESIGGALTKTGRVSNFERFSAIATRVVNFYDTPNALVVEFYDIPAEKLDQAATVTVLAPIYGEELATYLVYAKDSDGYQTDGETSLKDPLALSEAIEFEGGTYSVRRDVKKKSDDTVAVSFLIQVKENEKITRQGNCYDLGITSMYETMKYKLSDVLPQSFGGTDPVRFADFGVTHFNNLLPGYGTSDLQYLYLEVSENAAGCQGYSISGGLLDHDAKDASVYLFFDIYLEEKDGVMRTVYMKLDTKWNDYNLETKSQAYLDRSVQALRLLFPDLSFSDFTYQEGNNNYESAISSNILGVDVTGTYGVYLYGPQLSITLQGGAV